MEKRKKELLERHGETNISQVKATWDKI